MRAGGRWVVVNARVKRAAAPPTTRVWRGRFPQRCPPDQPQEGQPPLPLEEELADYDGEGTFFAAASLR